MAEDQDAVEEAQGAIVRNARELAKMSQMELADAVGVTSSLISKIEADKCSISVTVGKLLAHALGLDANQFLRAVERQKLQEQRKRTQARALITQDTASQDASNRVFTNYDSDAENDIDSLLDDVREACKDPAFQAMIVSMIRWQQSIRGLGKLKG